jgi:TPR repeat protein
MKSFLKSALFDMSSRWTLLRPAQTTISSPTITRVLLAAALLTVAVIATPPVLAQEQPPRITIVDENTVLPDYSAYEQGLDALYAGDYDTALREFRIAAAAGLELAQYNLGVMYYTGEGVEQDYQQAAQWLTQAAELGHLRSQFNLATMYYNGLGVTSPLMRVWPLSLLSRNQNRRQAARWYEQAAEYEHGEAQYNLATMYEAGEGVAQDPVTAYRWARLARDNEVADAAALVTRLEASLSPAQLNQAQTDYAQWVLEFRG